jgi:hypothetical protein
MIIGGWVAPISMKAGEDMVGWISRSFIMTANPKAANAAYRSWKETGRAP